MIPSYKCFRTCHCLCKQIILRLIVYFKLFLKQCLFHLVRYGLLHKKFLTYRVIIICTRNIIIALYRISRQRRPVTHRFNRYIVIMYLIHTKLHRYYNIVFLCIFRYIIYSLFNNIINSSIPMLYESEKFICHGS